MPALINWDPIPAINLCSEKKLRREKECVKHMGQDCFNGIFEVIEEKKAI